MAFNDNPKVDDNAKRSDESVTTVLQLFSRKEGFICREENPDYGVDLDIELIDDKSEASAEKFAIQIKSTNKTKTLKNTINQNHISFKFKTSRLGYIARRKPGYGLIVLYDEKTKISYYDYIENLIERISNHKKNDNWRDQDEVQIHIPKSNVLDKKSVKEIYYKIRLRFQNINTLLSNHGKSYNIPVFKEDTENKLSSSNNLEFLAPILINKQKFKLLCEELSKLSSNEIRKSRELCFYAAIAYCETGDMLEAKHYLSRCKAFKKYLNKEQIELLSLIEPKIEGMLGNISIKEFQSQIEGETSKIQSSLNKCNLKINLLASQVLDIMQTSNYNKDFEKNLVIFFEELENLDIKQEHKYSFIIQHCDTLYSYYESFIASIITEQRIKESLNISNNIDISNLISRAKHIQNETIKKLNSVTNSDIFKTSNELKSEFAILQGKMFLNKISTNIFLKYEIDSEVIKEKYNATLYNLSKAYEVFFNLTDYRKAYLCLNYSLDLRTLFNKYFKFKKDEKEDEKLRKRISYIETEIGTKKYDSQIEKTLSNSQKTGKLTIQEYFQEMTDEDLEYTVKTLVKIKNIPIKNIQNLREEIKSFRKFYKACDNPNLELNIARENNLYNTKSSYVVIFKDSGLSTTEKSNIEDIISMIEYKMKK